MTLDSAGNLYIADRNNHRIRKVDASTGIISTVAGTGTGTAAYGGDGGAATAAMLYFPAGVAAASDGSLYIADYGSHRVRKVDASTGIISTVAGTGMPGFGGDGGLASAAMLFSPAGVAAASDGKIYIADMQNHRIRRLVPRPPAAPPPAPLFGDSLRLPLNSLVSAGSDGDLRWTVASSDETVATVYIADDELVVEPADAFSEGAARIEVVASDALGQSVAVSFDVYVEFYWPVRAKGWRSVQWW